MRKKLINKFGNRTQDLASGVRVVKQGAPGYRSGDLYHSIMSTSWLNFLVASGLIYLVINGMFASLYFIKPGSILNASPDSYWETFLFSFQTSTTLGYGYYLPQTDYAHVVAIFDALSGILFVAILTGLAWGRFSRPTAKVLFTENVLLSKHNGKNCLIFRIANARTSNIVDAKLNVVAIIPEVSLEGVEMRSLKDLKLQRDTTPVFALTWLVVHEIDESSPLFNFPLNRIISEKISLIVTCTGIEDSLVQNVHTQNYYRETMFAEGERFEDMLEFKNGELTTMDFRKFHKYVPLKGCPKIT